MDLDKSPSTILNKCKKNKQCCLFPDFRNSIPLNFSLLDVGYWFTINCLYYVDVYPLYT